MVDVKKKEAGNIGDLIGAGLCMIAMLILMMSCFSHMALLQKKVCLGQTARKYMLRMETVGFLESHKEEELTSELKALGISELSLEGTTTEPVSYGEEITLRIRGKLEGGIDVYETKTSTAKN